MFEYVPKGALRGRCERWVPHSILSGFSVLHSRVFLFGLVLPLNYCISSTTVKSNALYHNRLLKGSWGDRYCSVAHAANVMTWFQFLMIYVPELKGHILYMTSLWSKCVPSVKHFFLFVQMSSHALFLPRSDEIWHVQGGMAVDMHALFLIETRWQETLLKDELIVYDFWYSLKYYLLRNL